MSERETKREGGKTWEREKEGTGMEKQENGNFEAQVWELCSAVKGVVWQEEGAEEATLAWQTRVGKEEAWNADGSPQLYDHSKQGRHSPGARPARGAYHCARHWALLPL